MMSEDPTYHIQLKKEQTGKYVILPGDRGRVHRIAKYLENAEVVGDNREYYTMTGWLEGVQVSVMSTGMGAPCVSIGVEELRTLGVHTYIRVGTAGALQSYLKMGEGIIPMGAVREDGTMDAYVPKAYPAVGNFEVIEALDRAATAMNHPHQTGIVLSTDAYYARFFNTGELAERTERFIRANALCVEMEVSSLYILSSIYRLRAGAIVTVREVIDNDSEYREQGGVEFEEGLERSIRTSIEAIRLLIIKDRA
jgi:uridine phosphorylase